jgi:hypothetical protein
VELVARLIEPLRTASQNSDLQVDIDDMHLGRIARYCARRTVTPPEIGAIRHFLQTAASSKRRQASSPLIGRLRAVVVRWPNSDWLFDVDRGLRVMAELTMRVSQSGCPYRRADRLGLFGWRGPCGRTGRDVVELGLGYSTEAGSS